MQLVDRGSRGPWLDFNDFALDAGFIKEVLSRGINLDGFTSFHNKVVDRSFSSGFQIEAEGTDFSHKNYFNTLPSNNALRCVNSCFKFQMQSSGSYAFMARVPSLQKFLKRRSLA